jgi:CheY-like chemotaxis protein
MEDVSSILNNILLIEDNELVRKTTVFNLHAWGQGAVDTASTGKAALDKLSQKKYDLIYLDLGLPDMDGRMIAEKIKQNKKSRNYATPIVALTAHADEIISADCIAKGINQVLTKPLLESDAKNIAAQFLNVVNVVSQSIDWPLWQKRCNDNQTLVKETQQILVKQLPDTLAKIRYLLGKKDYKKLMNTVNQCYGDLQYCGLPRLEQATIALRIALEAKEYKKLSALLKVFAEEVALICKKV